MKALNKLPRFALSLQQILTHAEDMEGLLPYDSDIRGLGYIAEPKRLLILTHKRGYLVIHKNDIDTLIFELKNIQEDMERRRWVTQNENDSDTDWG